MESAHGATPHQLTAASSDRRGHALALEIKSQNRKVVIPPAAQDASFTTNSGRTALPLELGEGEDVLVGVVEPDDLRATRCGPDAGGVLAHPVEDERFHASGGQRGQGGA